MTIDRVPHPAQPHGARSHGAHRGDQAHVHAGGHLRARRSDHRAVPAARRHPHAHPGRGRSERGAASGSRRSSSCARITPGRSTSSRASFSRKAGPDVPGADENLVSLPGSRRAGDRRRHPLRQGRARPDPPRIRAGAAVRRRRRFPSRRRLRREGARLSAGVRDHGPHRLAGPGRVRARLEVLVHAGEGAGGRRQAARRSPACRSRCLPATDIFNAGRHRSTA